MRGWAWWPSRSTHSKRRSSVCALPGAYKERAVPAKAELRVSMKWIRHHAVENPRRGARQPPSREIERNRKEGTVSAIHDVAGRTVLRVTASNEQDGVLARRERERSDGCVVPGLDVWCPNREEDVAATGKHVRKAVAVLLAHLIQRA